MEIRGQPVPTRKPKSNFSKRLSKLGMGVGVDFMYSIPASREQSGSKSVSRNARTRLGMAIEDLRADPATLRKPAGSVATFR